MQESEEMPEETIVFTQLFIGPLKKWSPRTRRAAAQMELERQMYAFIGWEERLQDARLYNLEMIESNRWEEFGPPEKWFW